jgi:hypothetical protein
MKMEEHTEASIYVRIAAQELRPVVQSGHRNTKI